MKISKFIEKTNVSRKTAIWLHDNIFNKNNNDNKHRKFTENDVNWVLMRKVENFKNINNIDIKPIDNCPNHFITSDGRIFNNSRGFLEERKYEINHGYRRINMKTLSGDIKHFRVGRLVGINFIPNPKNKPFINHKDGCKTHDDVSNLEWTTVSENTKHAFDNGLANNDKGIFDSQSIPVTMFDKYGYVLNQFGSIREASRLTNINLSTIRNHILSNKSLKNGVYFIKGFII